MATKTYAVVINGIVTFVGDYEDARDAEGDARMIDDSSIVLLETWRDTTDVSAGWLYAAGEFYPVPFLGVDMFTDDSEDDVRGLRRRHPKACVAELRRTYPSAGLPPTEKAEATDQQISKALAALVDCLEGTPRSRQDLKGLALLVPGLDASAIATLVGAQTPTLLLVPSPPPLKPQPSRGWVPEGWVQDRLAEYAPRSRVRKAGGDR